MNIFISWSGSRSKAVAELLENWLRCVLQVSQPWVSTHGIDRGAVWFPKVMNHLQTTNVGIICLTKENKSAPWILFEAGALAKGLLDTNRICTLLVDLTEAAVDDPLGQFNHTLPNKEGMRQLVHTLNKAAEKSALDSRIVDQVFETYWPQFEQEFNKALKANPTLAQPTAAPEEKAQNDILGEILAATRSLEKRLVRMDSEIAELRKEKEYRPTFQLGNVSPTWGALSNPANGGGLVMNNIGGAPSGSDDNRFIRLTTPNERV